MNWVKRFWFPVAATLLVGIIGYNLFTMARLGRSNSDAAKVNTASDESGTRGSSMRSTPSSASKKSISADLVSKTGPQDSVRRVKAQNADIDAEKLTAALEALGPVEKAVWDGDTVKLTINDSLNLSELVGRLGFQETALIENEFRLRGGLRLHVSGMN